MPRFVVLEHDWPERHWDFLLEAGESLRAWRLLLEPGPGRDVDAESNFDHRVIYLEFEGPLSGGRGSVTRWDAGSFEWMRNESDAVVVQLRGAKLSGVVRLAGGRFEWVKPELPSEPVAPPRQTEEAASGGEKPKTDPPPRR
jgi:hypothetical protein